MSDNDPTDPTRRIEVVPDEPPVLATTVVPAAPAYVPAGEERNGAQELEDPEDEVAEASGSQTVLYVPLAVTLGDGFKFGCGFFLAFVVAMLVGLLVVAALFALTSVFGIDLPVTR